MPPRPVRPECICRYSTASALGSKDSLRPVSPSDPRCQHSRPSDQDPMLCPPHVTLPGRHPSSSLLPPPSQIRVTKRLRDLQARGTGCPRPPQGRCPPRGPTQHHFHNDPLSPSEKEPDPQGNTALFPNSAVLRPLNMNQGVAGGYLDPRWGHLTSTGPDHSLRERHVQLCWPQTAASLPPPSPLLSL